MVKIDQILRLTWSEYSQNNTFLQGIFSVGIPFDTHSLKIHWEKRALSIKFFNFKTFNLNMVTLREIDLSSDFRNLREKNYVINKEIWIIYHKIREKIPLKYLKYYEKYRPHLIQRALSKRVTLALSCTGYLQCIIEHPMIRTWFLEPPITVLQIRFVGRRTVLQELKNG